jgi:hypothetical protein
VAARSREVEQWRQLPHSQKRVAIARKWAIVAANEAAYMAELHRRWEQDLEQGRPTHHITDDEVRPFAMPEGWTASDLKY